jgi:hypothetical protein
VTCRLTDSHGAPLARILKRWEDDGFCAICLHYRELEDRIEARDDREEDLVDGTEGLVECTRWLVLPYPCRKIMVKSEP